MLAIAQGGASTKAEGDITVGPKALYTVSEDGTMVQVSYNVDVEGADGEVAETIRANLIISPNFIFPVDEGWLWMANCSLDVKDGWSNGTIPQGPARSALSKIINGHNEKYHDRHGAHYLIRKSDGALFEWTLEAPVAGIMRALTEGFRHLSVCRTMATRWMPSTCWETISPAGNSILPEALAWVGLSVIPEQWEECRE